MTDLPPAERPDFEQPPDPADGSARAWPPSDASSAPPPSSMPPPPSGPTPAMPHGAPPPTASGPVPFAAGSGAPYPPPYPPPGAVGSPPKQRGGGSIVLGLGISLVSLTAGVVSLFGFLPTQDGGVLTGAIAGYLPVLLVVAGIVLAAIPRTRRTGAGILIGIGAAILIAGGLCVALLAQFNSVYGR